MALVRPGRQIPDGHVRINGVRQDAPAKAVSAGDVLTISLERDVKVLRVLAPGARRGPYEEARLLYEDLTPPKAPAHEAGALSDAGSGRPTKKDRRDIDRWQNSDKWSGGN